MSRFFNDSRKIARNDAAEPPKATVSERVGKLKEAIDAGRRPDDDFNPAQFKHALNPLENSNKIASSLVATRLEHCRAIRLPRHDEKSLLTPEYNLTMQQALESYQSLRTRLIKHQGKQGMRSLVVTSSGQGEGKTLTSFNLALSFARIQHWPVLLVDADLRTRGLSKLLGAPYPDGLASVLEGGCSYESAVLRTDVPNLYVLPAGESDMPAPELFSRPEWKEFIGWSSESFKLVLVDSPPFLDLADLELIAAPCEGVVLVARSGKASRESVRSTCARIDPKKLLGIVLNGSEDKPKNGYYYGYTGRRSRDHEGHSSE